MTQPKKLVKSINLSLTLIMLCCTSQRGFAHLIAALYQELSPIHQAPQYRGST